MGAFKPSLKTAKLTTTAVTNNARDASISTASSRAEHTKACQAEEWTSLKITLF